MSIYCILMQHNFAVLAQRRIQMTYELMTKQIEINPQFGTTARGTAQNITIELSRLGQIAHLDCNMKRRQPGTVIHVVLESVYFGQ